jgi:hypothetical protein
MPKKSRRAPARKKKTALRPRVAKAPTPQVSRPKESNRFVRDVLVREEAAPLQDGKLPLGKTHILEQDENGAPKITRARFTLA